MFISSLCFLRSVFMSETFFSHFILACHRWIRNDIEGMTLFQKSSIKRECNRFSPSLYQLLSVPQSLRGEVLPEKIASGG